MTCGAVRIRRRLLALFLPIMAGIAAAQSGGDFAIRKSVVAAGSQRASGGDYRIEASAGQHDTGLAVGGAFRAEGGFWPEPAPLRIFCDGFESAACDGE
jgi:hypothetical protein